MAYIQNEDENNQEQGMNVLGTDQQTDPAQQQTQPVNISGQSQSIGSGASTQAQPQRTVTPVKGKPQGSGMFVNTQKYVEANKPQASKIGGAISKGLDSSAGQIRQQIQSQQNVLRNQLDTNKARLDAARQFSQQAVQDAGQNVLQDPDFTRYQGLVTGDTQFDQVQQLDLSRQRAKAQALANLAGRSQTTGGRDELLQRTFAPTNRYTRGQRNIDALVLGSDQNVAKGITEGTQQQFQGLKSDIGQARSQALGDIQGLRTEAKTFTGREGEAAKTAIGARDTLGTELDQLAAARLTELEGKRAGLLEKIQKRAPLTFEEMDMLGIPQQDQGTLQAFLTTKEGVPSTYDFAQYLNVLDPKNFTRDTIANAEQRSRYDELAQLLGQQGLSNTGADPSLGYNSEAAIRGVLDAMDRGVGYSGGEFQGSDEDISLLKTLLVDLNPMIAAPLFVANTVSPFVFDAARGVVDVSGNVVKGVSDVVSAINPAVGGAFGDVADAIINDGIGGAVSVAENVVESAARAAASVFSGVFCFAKDVMIDMADGTTKAVQTLNIGDITYYGGLVMGAGQVMVDELFEYKGTRVTGEHAVLEGNRWIRVKDSKFSKRLDIETEIVYPIVTQNHVLISNGFVSADAVEINDDKFHTPDEKLDILNSQDNSHLINKYNKSIA